MNELPHYLHSDWLTGDQSPVILINTGEIKSSSFDTLILSKIEKVKFLVSYDIISFIHIFIYLVII